MVSIRNKVLQPGDVFGYMTVVQAVAVRNDGQRYYECKCRCGNSKLATIWALLNAQVRSCGCKKKEHNRIHGHSRELEYKAWISMRRRCANNPKSKYYKNYYLKGITICAEWVDYEQFKTDMGPIPEKGYTLERIDGEKGYSKQNCKWATTEEQNKNRRTNRYFLIDGVKKVCYNDLARFLGIKPYMIKNREVTKGMSVVEALEDLNLTHLYRSIEELK